jgi:hypothetical protein
LGEEGDCSPPLLSMGVPVHVHVQGLGAVVKVAGGGAPLIAGAWWWTWAWWGGGIGRGVVVVVVVLLSGEVGVVPVKAYEVADVLVEDVGAVLDPLRRRGPEDPVYVQKWGSGLVCSVDVAGARWDREDAEVGEVADVEARLVDVVVGAEDSD